MRPKKIDHLNINLELQGLYLHGLPRNLQAESFLRVRDVIVEKKINEIADMLNYLFDVKTNFKKND